MSFRIKALPLSEFRPLFDLSDAELAAQGVLRQVADRSPGFPCRVSLRDADPGETVLLINYEHLPVATPYRSRHAIFVRENAVQAHPGLNEVPEVLLTRLLSVRGFDEAGMMLEADAIPGTALATTIERMFEREALAYLHIHNAKPGCFAARAERA